MTSFLIEYIHNYNVATYIHCNMLGNIVHKQVYGCPKLCIINNKIIVYCPHWSALVGNNYYSDELTISDNTYIGY